MDFEQTLFRVHERSIDTLRLDQPCCGGFLKPSRVCAFIELVFFGTAVLLLYCLVVLHVGFVDNPGCLPDLLYPLLPSNASSMIDSDVVLQFNVEHPPLTETEELGPDRTYEFSKNIALLSLSDQFREEYNVEIRNVTLPKQCFGSASTQSIVDILDVYDTVVINMLMRVDNSPQARAWLIPRSDSANTNSNTDTDADNNEGTTEEVTSMSAAAAYMGMPGPRSSDGGLHNTRTGEWWKWDSDTLFIPSTWLGGLCRRVGYFLISLVSLFLFSCVSSLCVRMLISSGVVVMFPLFHLLRVCGVSDVDMRLVTLSYPWLGLPLERLRALRKPTLPFLMAHVAQVVVYYSMYEASQVAWSYWFYSKLAPEGLAYLLFGTVMLWEYFSIVFLRSRLGIRFFPRFMALYFLLFHLYFYAFAYPFSDVAVVLLFVSGCHAMVFTVRRMELPALANGSVSVEYPRAYFSRLGWPSWSALLPPSWSMFLPVNSEAQNIYDLVPPTVGGGGGGEAGAAAAGATGEEDEGDDAGAGTGAGAGSVAGPGAGAGAGAGSTGPENREFYGRSWGQALAGGFFVGLGHRRGAGAAGRLGGGGG